LTSWRKAKSFRIDDPDLALQVRISKMLGLAFALSIARIFGIGSLIALIIGLKVRRIIRKSQVKLSGSRMAWWCIIAGALGSLFLIPLTVAMILKQWK
jgi:uncharacterized membrane protein YdcZ (DUF606 family)